MSKTRDKMKEIIDRLLEEHAPTSLELARITALILEYGDLRYNEGFEEGSEPEESEDDIQERKTEAAAEWHENMMEDG